jgi:inner membrane protease subunit 2
MWGGWSGSKRVLVQAFWGVPVLLTIKDCTYWPVLVDGRSMQPVFNPDPDGGRDLALVEKFGLLLYRYERGAVYLLKSPDTPHKLMVKRLIALEGDWISIPGIPVPHQINKGFCWIEGDNESESQDSRTSFGEVPIALLKGKVVRLVWPLQRAGAVANSLPPNRLLLTNPHALKKNRVESV